MRVEISRTASEPTAGTRWWIVGLLAAALFINYVDRGAVPTAAHLIQDELGFSARQLGLLFSAFFWSYTLLQIPVGWVAERYGAQRVLAGGLACGRAPPCWSASRSPSPPCWRCDCCSASAKAPASLLFRNCSQRWYRSRAWHR